MRRFLELTALHAAATLAGWATSLAGIPLPWLIGPMLATATMTLALDVPRTPLATRATGQLVIGAAVGLYLTPEAMLRILDSLGAILLSAVIILGVSIVIAVAEIVATGVNRATAVFSCVPGGPVEMANLAALNGGDPARAALAQTMRIVAIVLFFPPILALGGLKVEASMATLGQAFDTGGLALMLALGVVAGAVAGRLRIPNPFFLGPLLAIGVLTASNVHLPAIPNFVIAAAQILMGVSLGSIFRPDLLRSGGRLILASLTSTMGLIATGVATAFLLASAFDHDMATMLLANAPGSVAEMAVTAKLTHLDVSLVTAFHCIRIVLILLVMHPLYKIVARVRPDREPR